VPVGIALTWFVIEDGTLAQSVGGWIAPLGIRLRADGLSAILLLALPVIGSLVAIHARGYFGKAGAAADVHKARYFWPLWLFLAAALNGMFLSADAFNLYVTLELAGLAAVVLVALANDGEALEAAQRYLFVSLSGSLLYLMGVALLYGAHGTVDFELLARSMAPEPHAWIALALMTGGLMMKGALFPLHFWLPPAHSSAPAPVSALLSALVVKGSFYILLRLWFEPFGSIIPEAAAQLIGACGACAILYGSVQALFQSRLKLLVAYSTVAQLGYLSLLFPLAFAAGERGTVWTGGIVFLLAHAAAKAAMFLAAGNIIHAAGHDRIRYLDGMTGALPLSVFTVGLAGISLVGLPPSAGFVAKWYLLSEGIRQGQWWWVAVIIAGGLLAAGYMIRLLIHAFTQAPVPKTWRRISPGMEWSAFALAAAAFLLGFAAKWPAQLLEGVLAGGGGP
jgi:formate hydrogenlyase subunit 3/multisubunit Na+/H+ antiporter MnhD subunit